MKGIDVAKWNHEKIKNTNIFIDFDWKKIKDSGVEFVIAKVINKQCNIEDSFLMNYNGAQSQGILTDVYNYSYATTVEKAVSDANKVISIIKGKNIDYVWLDIEDKCQNNLGMTLINIITAYKEVIEKAGFKFGVYTGLSFYNEKLKPFHSFFNCPFWIARYPSKQLMNLSDNPSEDKKPSIMHPLSGWQYTSAGRVDGITGNVDLSIKYDMAEDDSRPVLRQGSTGNDVIYLQQRLTAKGYGVGTIDGKFGIKTLEAVKAFQAENNLTVDGIAGEKTWTALENKDTGVNVLEYSLKRDGETQLSKNYKAREFRCKDGSDKILIDANFVQDKLQAIRDHFNAPVTINSAYRTESYNTKVGGAKSSYHMKGQAFDIAISGHTPLEVAQYAEKLGINGIIQYNTFVHVDSRATRYWARNNNGKVTVKKTFL